MSLSVLSGAVVAAMSGPATLSIALLYVCRRYRNLEACHQLQVGSERVPGVTWGIRPTPEAYDGVRRPCRFPIVGRGEVSKIQNHPLDRSGEIEAGHAVVGHFKEAADLPFLFAATVPGRAIPELLATDPSSAAYICGLVVLGTVVIFVSLKRGG